MMPASEEAGQATVDNLDAHRREMALNIDQYQATMVKAYNKTVRSGPIYVGDLVLKKKIQP